MGTDEEIIQQVRHLACTQPMLFWFLVTRKGVTLEHRVNSKPEYSWVAAKKDKQKNYCKI